MDDRLVEETLVEIAQSLEAPDLDKLRADYAEARKAVETLPPDNSFRRRILIVLHEWLFEAAQPLSDEGGLPNDRDAQY